MKTMSFFGIGKKRFATLATVGVLAATLCTACNKNNSEPSFAQKKSEIISEIANQSLAFEKLVQAIPDQTYLGIDDLDKAYSKIDMINTMLNDGNLDSNVKENGIVLVKGFQKERMELMRSLLNELLNMKVVDKNTRKINYDTVIKLKDEKYLTVKQLLEQFENEYNVAQKYPNVLSKELKTVINQAIDHIDRNIGSAIGKYDGSVRDLR